ncbi:3'-5' exonuclease [Lacticaseibacillus thailandensis]|uniref:3'-5' exonuclease n=1 Tax=Lacticaseibacillus thailandensis TaxID=381741 RepID=UPI0006CF9052|nr:3'-5' exonuclease [Lacticaseibacillus thailandensis]
MTRFIAQYDAATADATTTSAYHKLMQFREQLTGFRDLARSNRLVDLIWAIYQETGYLDFVGGMPGGPQRQANLRALYDRAHAYEEGGFRGLFAFVHFIELMQQRDKDLDTPVTIDPDTNAVHLMTIHGSKGLQFPVVFLMNSSRSLHGNSNRGDSKAILSGGQIGIQWLQEDTRVQIPLPQYELARQDRDGREQAEALRVLYVALTRAEQHLYVVGYGATRERLEQSWRKLANTNDLVLPAYNRLTAASLLALIGASLVRHPHYPDQTDPLVGLVDDPTMFTINWVTHPKVAGGAQTQLAVTQPPLDVDVDQWFSFQYPYAAATQTTGFQAVSEIKRLFDDPSLTELHADPQTSGHQVLNDGQAARRYVEPFATPQFITGGVEARPSAAAIGTATHQVMQSLDLHVAITPTYVAGVIEDLVDRQLITATVGRNVNIDHIVAFFTTPLGQTLLQTPDTVQREVPFAMLMPAGDVFPAMRNDEQNLLVHGIMDGFVTTPDGVILYDYKTDHVGHQQDAIVTKYSGQLNLYALALRQIQPAPVIGLRLVLLETNTVVALAVQGAYDINSNNSSREP